jgi:hypothetical protein
MLFGTRFAFICVYDVVAMAIPVVFMEHGSALVDRVGDC